MNAVRQNGGNGNSVSSSLVDIFYDGRTLLSVDDCFELVVHVDTVFPHVFLYRESRGDPRYEQRMGQTLLRVNLFSRIGIRLPNTHKKSRIITAANIVLVKKSLKKKNEHLSNTRQILKNIKIVCKAVF